MAFLVAWFLLVFAILVGSYLCGPPDRAGGEKFGINLKPKTPRSRPPQGMGGARR